MSKKANESLLVDFNDVYCGLLEMYRKLSALYFLFELLRDF